MTSDEQLELLRSCVALRVQSRQVRESVRVGLASIEQTLIVHAGPLVRKTVAARLLGCSVQAIDRHVAKGSIPVEPIADGAKRTAIPIRPLLDIAYEQALAGGTLTGAIEAATVRRLRTAEFVTARNLTLFAHQIAQSARKREAS
jgi:hypothetical protein